MYRAALRSTPRALRPARQSTFTAGTRRFLTTAPAGKKGTWRGTAMRWGLAIGALYWYNTSPIFADEAVPRAVPPPPQFADSDIPTVESIVKEKRVQAEEKAAAARAEAAEARDAAQLPAGPGGEAGVVTVPHSGQAQSPEALEEEAGQQGAFDPETGEINWDCPCLGGMAHGPCGEEFKAAFSCFVYSKEEPKGMDCIDKFQHMQDCFRQYPEVYGAELGEDEEETSPASIGGAEGDDSTGQKQAKALEAAPETTEPPKAQPSESAAQNTGIKKNEDAENALTPKRAFDATDANRGNE